MKKLILFLFLVLLPSLSHSADRYVINPYTGKFDNAGPYTGNVGLGTTGTSTTGILNHFAGFVGVATIGPFQTVEVSGNVGIGTITPYGGLHIYNTTESNAAVVLGNGAQNNGKVFHPGVNVQTPSYSNTGGTGSRQSIITVTSSGLTWNNGSDLPVGDITLMVDGVTGVNNLYNFISSVSGNWVLFDFGVGALELITEVKWIQSGTQSHGTHRWQGSNNGTDFFNIGNSFTLGGATTQTQTELSGNTTGYRYYRLLGVSGTWSNGPYLYEIEFKIGDPGGAIIRLATFTDGTTADGIISLQRDGGNVGIGNETGVNKLEVTGSASVSANVGIGTITPLTALAVWEGNVGIGTFTSSNRLTIKGGNVGIGTNSAPNLLYVAGTAEMQGFKMNASAGTNYVLTSNSVGVGTWQPIPLSKSFVITGATTASDFGNVWRVPKAVTLRAIHCLAVGGTNVVGQLQECDSNGANCVDVDSDMTCTAATNVNDDGSLSNPSLDAGDYLGVKTTSVSGTNTNITWTYEYD